MTKIYTANQAREMQESGTQMQFEVPSSGKWVDCVGCLWGTEYNYRIKPIESRPAEDRGRIPVGTRVRVVGIREPGFDYRGKTGSVEHVDDSSIPYHVRFDTPYNPEIRGAWFRAQDLELLDAEQGQGHHHRMPYVISGQPRTVKTPELVPGWERLCTSPMESFVNDVKKILLSAESFPWITTPSKSGLSFAQFSGRIPSPSRPGIETDEQIVARLLS